MYLSQKSWKLIGKYILSFYIIYSFKLHAFADLDALTEFFFFFVSVSILYAPLCARRRIPVQFHELYKLVATYALFWLRGPLLIAAVSEANVASCAAARSKPRSGARRVSWQKNRTDDMRTVAAAMKKGGVCFYKKSLREKKICIRLKKTVSPNYNALKTVAAAIKTVLIKSNARFTRPFFHMKHVLLIDFSCETCFIDQFFIW